MKTITELQDYQNLAQRTAGTNEDVNSDVLEKRLCLIEGEGYEKLIFLLVSLHKAAVVGDDATRLKSLLFYGKDKGKDVDHKKPLALGGSSSKSNLRLRSQHANRSDKSTIFKGKKTTRPKNPRKG